MVTGKPTSHPVPVTRIFVPRGPDVGEIVIEGAAGGALVGGCDDGVTVTVADGVARLVRHRQHRKAGDQPASFREPFHHLLTRRARAEMPPQWHAPLRCK